jgi:Fe-S cluster biogenesis protein NfuA
MSDVEEKINKIITESILPSVQMHGGHVELQSFKDGIVTVFLSGACSGCAMSTLTLKMGIENMLKYYIINDTKSLDISKDICYNL